MVPFRTRRAFSATAAIVHTCPRTWPTSLPTHSTAWLSRGVGIANSRATHTIISSTNNNYLGPNSACINLQSSLLMAVRDTGHALHNYTTAPTLFSPPQHHSSPSGMSPRRLQCRQRAVRSPNMLVFLWRPPYLHQRPTTPLSTSPHHSRPRTASQRHHQSQTRVVPFHAPRAARLTGQRTSPM